MSGDIEYSQRGHKALITEAEEAMVLEAVTRQLVTTQQTEECCSQLRVCEKVTALHLLVVMLCMCTINPIINPKSINIYLNNT
jgi:hypothetical protein